MTVISCAFCKYIIWSSVSVPLCSRIKVQPDNKYVPTSIARSVDHLCGPHGKFYEEMKLPKRRDEVHEMID